jgi:hypothetical protein
MPARKELAMKRERKWSGSTIVTACGDHRPRIFGTVGGSQNPRAELQRMFVARLFDWFSYASGEASLPCLLELARAELEKQTPSDQVPEAPGSAGTQPGEGD